MKYNVAYGESTCDLAELVDSMILDGWKPQGGIAIVVHHYVDRHGVAQSSWCFYQAMITDDADRPAAKPAPSEEL